MGHKVVRIWAGHMMTSLEMAGVLVSVLKVGTFTLSKSLPSFYLTTSR